MTTVPIRILLAFLFLLHSVDGQDKTISQLPPKEIEDGDLTYIVSGGTDYKVDIGEELDTRDTANRDRANHTGEQSIDTVAGLQTDLDALETADARTDNPHAVTAAQTGAETTAQLNARDTANRSRANHTGEQAISTVTGLQAALDNISVTVNADATVTFDDSSGSPTDFREGQLRRSGDDSWVLTHGDGYDMPNGLDAANARNINLGTKNSFIGAATMPTIGTVADFGLGTPAEYAVDSAYVGGSVNVVTIGGGYDHVNNAIAGTISGGGHNFIKYNIGGHSYIGGGSWNLIDSERSSIVGGSMNQIVDTAGLSKYSFISGGLNNRLDATLYSQAFGSSNTITSANHSAASGTGNTVSTGTHQFAIGNTNTATGGYHQHAIGEGNSSTNGSHQYVYGLNNVSDDREHTIVRGVDGKAMSDHSDTLARTKLDELGDAQTSRHISATRTTNSTITNLSPQINNLGAKVISGFGSVYVLGTRDGTANGDANYSQVAYKMEFGFYWDGTNGYFFREGAESTFVAAPTMSIPEVTHTLNTFTPGAAAKLAIGTGNLRIQVTGNASTTINWVGRMELVYTTISL